MPKKTKIPITQTYTKRKVSSKISEKSPEDMTTVAPTQVSWKGSEKDVGLAEDMIFALKNLVAIEDHASSSFTVTENPMWLDVLDLARKLRTKWISLLVSDEKGHTWCISKHCLASSMGLLEVGNRFKQMGRDDLCKDAIKDSTLLNQLFLEINKIGGKNVQSTSA